MDEPIITQARDVYRTVRMLKQRLCQTFQERARENSDAFSCAELTFVQGNVLMAIEERGELSMKELADALHVSCPSASAMVDRLVDMGMLTREQSQADRREVRIYLTAQGKIHFQALEVQILEYITGLLLKLGPTCATQWCAVYARIREIIELEISQEQLQSEKKDVLE